MDLLATDLLVHVFSYLGPDDLRSCQLSCKSWNEILTKGAPSVWKSFCREYLALDTMVLPNESTLSTEVSSMDYYYVWKAWVQHYKGYPLDSIRKARHAWRRIEIFTAKHIPAVYQSLAPGASEEELNKFEKMLDVTLPQCVRLMYRIHDGQTLTFDQNRFFGSDQDFHVDDSIFHGLLGGYSFYDHFISMRLLPLRIALLLTDYLRGDEFFDDDPECVVLGCSFNSAKYLYVNTELGDLYLCNGMIPREDLRCTPLLDNPQDAFLEWLSEYSRRLEDGTYRVALLHPDDEATLGINLFPTKGPSTSVCVTRGIEVHASSLLAVEVSDARKLFHTYSITMRNVGSELSSCQLTHRHWIINEADSTKPKELRDAAVIGKYPRLVPGHEPFSYQSCTPMHDPVNEITQGLTEEQEERLRAQGYRVVGTMEGDFTFVPGTIAAPEGPPFDAIVARFNLIRPAYIY
eukprot:TRINITY_DN6465_c0_g1::TRINITY_DN6465_c0_g1_i1::g.22456::m.22456 TRINITY_DN6465_c0_g1::TRINITY_DN6465_c0_g1_i1::g.22456  ORF type:complete len:462 (+),score=49.33,sp/Q9LND7/SKI16_ARATH/30.71/2e-55,DUF525/PF04379.9/8.7e-15,DUF525/PF04379.9/5.5e+02,F-box-like/PF12937.2/4.5e-07,F-box-like/PF12937.2/3e+02,SMI1_KNR4/PF09346.5/9.7e-06,F-box/PF00646.28/7.7e-05 TRINITY_DN6465_c0_g1_i1:27-1412(+)